MVSFLGPISQLTIAPSLPLSHTLGRLVSFTGPCGALDEEEIAPRMYGQTVNSLDAREDCVLTACGRWGRSASSNGSSPGAAIALRDRTDE